MNAALNHYRAIVDEAAVYIRQEGIELGSYDSTINLAGRLFTFDLEHTDDSRALRMAAELKGRKDLPSQRACELLTYLGDLYTALVSLQMLFDLED